MYEGTWGIPYTDVRVYEYTIYKYTNIREPSLEQMDRVCQYIIFFFFFILEYRLIVLAELLTNPY